MELAQTSRLKRLTLKCDDPEVADWHKPSAPSFMKVLQKGQGDIEWT